MPTGSGKGESLYVAAPDYPCYDVVFQPNFQHCLMSQRNQDCITIYRGFVNYCGFSWDGNILIVVDGDINVWCREGL